MDFYRVFDFVKQFKTFYVIKLPYYINIFINLKNSISHLFNFFFFLTDYKIFILILEFDATIILYSAIIIQNIVYSIGILMMIL